MTDSYEILTDRLILRRLREDDAEKIFYGWANDPDTTKYLSWEPHRDPAQTRRVLEGWLSEYEKQDTYRYGIEERETGELTGMIDVVGYHHGNPVIGYVLSPRFRRRGYMTEALAALRDRLLRDGYKTIVIEAADANKPSNAVIKKCGFELVGTWEESLGESKPEKVPVNSYRYFSEKRKSGDYNDINSETIDRWVAEGWRWGVPITHEEFERAKEGDCRIVLTPTKPVPREWIGEVRGKRVLGLASGGGQQMPVFAAMGAECWVLDFSARQIASEIFVAKREGYEIRAIRADMTKPLPFSDGFFDLIFHPVSNCYIRDVEPVWRECARILKPGGRLLAGLDSGINFLFEEDESRVVNVLPYDPLSDPAKRAYLEEHGEGIEFSHGISEQIGGQIRAGLAIKDVYDDTNGEGFLHEHNAPSFWATLAEKV